MPFNLRKTLFHLAVGYSAGYTVQQWVGLYMVSLFTGSFTCFLLFSVKVEITLFRSHRLT